jgi:hypothetical protein
MKQTAIEWLLKEWPILKSELPHWLIEQAKEMERDQINDAYFQGFEDNVWDAYDDLYNIEYYKETYGGNK